MQASAGGPANFLSGAMPGLERGIGMLAQLPLLKYQAQQMEEQRALRSMSTLVELLKLPDPMGSVALEKFGPQLGLDEGLLATLKRGKEDQRREIAQMIEETNPGSGPGVAIAMRALQSNPTAAFEYWRKWKEKKNQDERFASLNQFLGDDIEIPGARPQPAAAPAPPAAPAAPPMPDPMGEGVMPAPPPAPPSVAGPAGAIAPAAPTAMPTEPGRADWQNKPEYRQSVARVERAMNTIENINRGYAAISRRATPAELKEYYDPLFKQRLDNAKAALDAAQKDLAVQTPEYAAHVETRDPITGKTVVTAVDKRGQRLGTIGNAPFRAQSPIGQTLADVQDVERTLGKDHPDARAMRDVFEMSGEDKALGLDKARLEIAKLEKEIANVGKADVKDEGNLREKFLAQSKTWNEARSGYSRIMVGDQQDDLAGDIALIYGYAKMLDPEGAVREGDYNSIANRPGIPGFLKDLMRGLQGDRRLTDDRRREIYNAATRLYNQYEGTQRFNQDTFRGLASQYQMPPDRVVPDLIPQRDKQGRPIHPPAPAPTPQTLPRPAAQGTPESLATAEERTAAARAATARSTAEVRAQTDQARDAIEKLRRAREALDDYNRKRSQPRMTR